MFYSVADTLINYSLTFHDVKGEIKVNLQKGHDIHCSAELVLVHERDKEYREKSDF